MPKPSRAPIVLFLTGLDAGVNLGHLSSPQRHRACASRGTPFRRDRRASDRRRGTEGRGLARGACLHRAAARRGHVVQHRRRRKDHRPLRTSPRRSTRRRHREEIASRRRGTAARLRIDATSMRGPPRVHAAAIADSPTAQPMVARNWSRGSVFRGRRERWGRSAIGSTLAGAV